MGGGCFTGAFCDSSSRSTRHLFHSACHYRMEAKEQWDEFCGVTISSAVAGRQVTQLFREGVQVHDLYHVGPSSGRALRYVRIAPTGTTIAEARKFEPGVMPCTRGFDLVEADAGRRMAVRIQVLDTVERTSSAPAPLARTPCGSAVGTLGLLHERPATTALDALRTDRRRGRAADRVRPGARPRRPRAGRARCARGRAGVRHRDAAPRGPARDRGDRARPIARDAAGSGLDRASRPHRPSPWPGWSSARKPSPTSMPSRS